jgi:murein DD-endopeptidase MepM/ murein hydrolase activator NlpD
MSQLGQPHHDYPAIDLLVPEGTPVYAPTDGTVVRATHFPQE